MYKHRPKYILRILQDYMFVLANDSLVKVLNPDHTKS